MVRGGARPVCSSDVYRRNLADLEIEGPAAVGYPLAVPFEPGEHRAGQLGRVAMPAGVRWGAHAIGEHALWWHRAQIQQAFIE